MRHRPDDRAKYGHKNPRFYRQRYALGARAKRELYVSLRALMLEYTNMSETTLSKFRVAIYGVLIENGRVLLTETAVPSGVITNFPGGGLELGESPKEALAREFIEEVGIEVEIGEMLYCTQLFQRNPEYPHEQLIHIYYRVTRRSGEVATSGNGDDVRGACWVSPDELAQKRILGVDLEFINHPAFRGVENTKWSK